MLQLLQRLTTVTDSVTPQYEVDEGELSGTTSTLPHFSAFVAHSQCIPPPSLPKHLLEWGQRWAVIAQ